MSRNFNEYDKFAYTLQTGNHALNVVTALSISDKSGCGEMDSEMMINMQKEVENKKLKL